MFSLQRQVQEEEEEQDQLELLELRRLALESAALRMSKHTKNTDDVVPASSQSSAMSTSVKESSSETSQHEHGSKAQETKSDNFSPPKSTVFQVNAQKSDSRNHSVPKGQGRNPTSAAHGAQPSLERRAEAGFSATGDTGSQDKASGREVSKDRDGDSKPKGSRERTRRGEAKEKENSDWRAGKSDRGRAVSHRRSRPLPFAPVKLDKITLKSISPRAGGLTDAARRGMYYLWLGCG